MHPDFEKNGYMVVRNFFDETTMDILGKYFNMKYKVFLEDEETRKKTNVTKFDNFNKYCKDVAESINFYGDTLVESIQLKFGAKLCSVLCEDLSPTYTFTRIYEKDSKLLPHIDRPSCEISVTAPIFISDERSSKIFVSNYTWNEFYDKPYTHEIDEIEKLGRFSEVNLYPGDILIYNGVDRYHWRRPLESDYMIQSFFHFVKANGMHKDFIFDKRPFLGFPDYQKGK